MYVNTYVIPVPETQKHAYIDLATTFIEVARDFGALQAFENWELEVPDGALTDYRRAVLAQPNEKIAVAWVVWPDRTTAAQAHKGMFEDPRMHKFDEPPFDGVRMIQGGFEPIAFFST
ncbi:MAG: DUF1428 domain-containing protein [Gammaproteobacteria bacterium TMED92]|nr:MAG: DUF1428 domain-containing protein [Gammaproteobacteria bacterium TMED92]|tara:strand:+ start:147 stop:500 length:354 start_codon:yes stop_codon:yes gene_type:complete